MNVKSNLIRIMLFLLVIAVWLSPFMEAKAPGKIAFIFDASGSMWGQIDGKAKIQIAREVLSGIIKDLPQDMVVGLTVYGHRSKGDCNDVEELLPLGPLNKEKMIKIINGLNPKGKTPISRSVKKVADKLKTIEDEVTILLISDGKETCDSDPCALVKSLKESGIKFKMHVIGFDVQAEEKKQLDCMARAGGGLYYSAANAGEFKKAFQEIAGQVKIGQGPGKLELPKATFTPVEEVVVKFTAQPDYADNAWIGILPSEIPHGDESVNDEHELTYQYIRKKTSGTMTFNVPKNEGKYDFRMFNTDGNGVETASVSFTVAGKLKKGTVTLEKKLFKPQEEIVVKFTAQPYFKNNAWVGIVPESCPHGKEVDADAVELSYQYLRGELKGTRTFRAPGKPGNYDIRMFDTDDSGDEVASLSFKVEADTTKPTLRCEPREVKPGQTIKVYFTASSAFPDDAWVGIVPSNIAHGSESTNDDHDKGYRYLRGQTEGVLEFDAPSEPGSYDFRMNDTDNSGKEVASVTFIVKK